MLERLLAGLDSLDVDRRLAWRVTAKAALDCVPRLRRQAVRLLAERGETGTKDVAVALDYPTRTMRRALEDLTAHRIVQRSGGKNQDLWRLTEAGRRVVRACLRARFVGKGAEHISSLYVAVCMYDDIPGTQAWLRTTPPICARRVSRQGEGL